ncbi:MAG: hypothetical protein ACI8ZM_004235 [Crocinitomix sp.]|jgi:hypothetical protein
MTLLEITAAMQAYANQRNTRGATTMQGWYNNRNMFPYTRDNNNQPIPPATEAYVHAYPGIVNNTLIFFVISAYKDVPGNTNIENDIEVCATSWLNPGSTPSGSEGQTGDPLPVADALNLIQNWIGNYSPWIGNNITTIFQAFRIPQSDSSYGSIHNATLALKSDSSTTGVASDVVVQDVNSQIIEYFDTVQPVPPFPISDPETDYYLYTLLT